MKKAAEASGRTLSFRFLFVQWGGKSRRFLLYCFRSDSFDIYELAHATPVAELDNAADLRKKRVVLAPTHVLTRFDPRATLADDDGTARNHLAAEHFDTQPLRVRIAPVFGTA
jgi:hypothetical protein